MSASLISRRPPEVRKDAVFNRWIIFSSARSNRPSDFKSQSSVSSLNSNPNPNPPSCPFCLGREHECAPEIFRIPHETNEWKIRVIENLYPALRRDLDPSLCSECCLTGYGYHDVVIETPLHGVHLPNLSQEEISEVVIAFRDRMLQLAKHGSLEYVQVFKNYGATAGASMAHSHSQIIGLPFVPPTVFARINSTKEAFSKSGKCCLCEAASEDILIDESIHFLAFVPFAASFPFEVWIIPKEHSSYFHDLEEQQAVDFAGLLKLILLKLAKQLNDPPYNFMIHSSPFHLSSVHLSSSHWFMQIIPQLSVAGGFEIGTGCYINPVFPEDAAKLLREVSCTFN